MKEFLKTFCLRGLMVMGFGPLVYAIVMLVLHFCNVNTTSDGMMIFKGILSTSLVAFICAGATTIYKIEKLGPGLLAVIHGIMLYIAYLSMYLVNGWLENNLVNVLIFSTIFITTFLIIWLIIYVIEKKKAQKLNSQLK